MILDSEYVLRAIELRMKTVKLHGSLCTVARPDLLVQAMKYHGVWEWEGYISNPFHELKQEVFDNLNLDLFHIFMSYSHHWNPPFTSDEIKYIIKSARKFGYIVTIHDKRASFRRDITHDNLRTRLRDKVRNRQ